jgi:hypothetical protein
MTSSAGNAGRRSPPRRCPSAGRNAAGRGADLHACRAVPASRAACPRNATCPTSKVRAKDRANSATTTRLCGAWRGGQHGSQCRPRGAGETLRKVALSRPTGALSSGESANRASSRWACGWPSR